MCGCHVITTTSLLTTGPVWPTISSHIRTTPILRSWLLESSIRKSEIGRRGLLKLQTRIIALNLRVMLTLSMPTVPIHTNSREVMAYSHTCMMQPTGLEKISLSKSNKWCFKNMGDNVTSAAILFNDDVKLRGFGVLVCGCVCVCGWVCVWV